MIEPGDAEWWVYRRDDRVRAPRVEMVARTGDGIPYLLPHGALLYKAKSCLEVPHVRRRPPVPSDKPVGAATKATAHRNAAELARARSDRLDDGVARHETCGPAERGIDDTSLKGPEQRQRDEPLEYGDEDET